MNLDHDFDPHLDGPGKISRVMIWRDGEAREVELTWGFAPVKPGGRPLCLLRAEHWPVDNPCLVLANEFGLKQDGEIKYAASLITDEPFFCLAGTWRPARSGWPASFAVFTVPAYPDLEPYKDRHVAVVRPDDWYHWLMGTKPKDEVLAPYPLGSFRVFSTSRRRTAVQTDLFR
ncbi:SOS response-associated peptidase family protein [Sphingomonas tabacisoli]|uniref:SOS response-associated peptidase family protein n=1 Tax=Sphingomonas tabacisoli TaxID=2249466 RepID=A0ABW4HZY1_9SPHN